jgi:hypothetical protein
MRVPTTNEVSHLTMYSSQDSMDLPSVPESSQYSMDLLSVLEWHAGFTLLR